jgi:glutaredoxin
MTNLVLFSRQGCPECDEVRAAMNEAGFEFEEIDVSTDAALEAEHGIFLPVIEASGEIIFHTGMDPKELVSEILPNL